MGGKDGLCDAHRSNSVEMKGSMGIEAENSQGLGSCGAYVSEKVSLDQPSFEVWTGLQPWSSHRCQMGWPYMHGC